MEYFTWTFFPIRFLSLLFPIIKQFSILHIAKEYLPDFYSIQTFWFQNSTVSLILYEATVEIFLVEFISGRILSIHHFVSLVPWTQYPFIITYGLMNALKPMVHLKLFWPLYNIWTYCDVPVSLQKKFSLLQRYTY